jgi:site-specific DNA-cytosine methylase
MTLWFVQRNPSRGVDRRKDVSAGPLPIVSAGRLSVGNTCDSHYWLEEDGMPDSPLESLKPPYRVPLMAEMAATPLNGFKVISSFSGCGGSCLGLRMAGFETVWANEFVPAARAVYRLNHPGVFLDGRDVRRVTPQHIFDATGLGPGEADVMEGSPPCFLAGTPVLTPRGPAAIEDLRSGDEVLSHEGRWRNVTTVHARQYEGALTRLRVKYGRDPFLSTPEHPVLVRRRDEIVLDHVRAGVVVKKKSIRRKCYGEPEWVAAEDVRPGDLVLEPHVRDFRAPSLTGVRTTIGYRWGPENFVQEKPPDVDLGSLDVARLLGLYLAEGHLRGHNAERPGPNRREVIFSVSVAEADQVATWCREAGFNPYVDCGHSPGAARVTITSADLWAACLAFGKGAAGKFIPEWCQSMPLAWREQLLEAYFWGDGHAAPNGRSRRGRVVSATTVSPGLAAGASRLVAATLGVIASRSCSPRAGTSVICGRTVNVRDVWTVRHAPEQGLRTRPGFVDDQGAWLPVVAVEETPPVCATVYNLDVEADHSYTAFGFACHNCAGFSTAGKRQAGWNQIRKYSDTRQRVDDLFFEFARLLEGVRPKTFMAENVSGLVKGVAKGYFKEILARLKGCGYRVEARLLDAQWLGVPQMRQRLFFVGVRDDLAARGLAPAFPRPLPYRYSVREAVPWIFRQGDNGGFGGGGMREATGPSPTIGAGPRTGNGAFPPLLVEARVVHDTSGTHSQGDVTDRPCPAITVGVDSLNASYYQVVGDGPPLAGYAIGREWDGLEPGAKSDKYINLVRPDPERSCPTVTAEGGNQSKASVTHPVERRKFTILELKRICAFPDDFRLVGTFAQQWERLGRSVPPLMAFAVAREIRDRILLPARGGL